MTDFILQFLHQIEIFLKDHNVSIQVDPLAFTISFLSIVIAVRANKKSNSIAALERLRGGQLKEVLITEHAMQAHLNKAPGVPKVAATASRLNRSPEGFVCRATSGSTPVEVEGAFLDIFYARGFWTSTRYVIHVDLAAGEGLALPPPLIPTRIEPHSSIDWTFPTFLTATLGGREKHRVLDVLRLLSLTETLVFKFGAFSRSSPLAATFESRHGARFPFRFVEGPWTRVVEYSSLWDAVMQPTSPESLQGWFLEWVECRKDFLDRVEADPTDALRKHARNIRKQQYWPAGSEAIGTPGRLSLGYLEPKSRSARFWNAFLLIPDRPRVDRGRVLSGPGGSGIMSQERLRMMLAILRGEVATVRLDEIDEWYPVHSVELIETALAFRTLYSGSRAKKLTRQETAHFERLRAAIVTEVSRCTYLSNSESERLLDGVLKGA